MMRDELAVASCKQDQDLLTVTIKGMKFIYVMVKGGFKLGPPEPL